MSIGWFARIGADCLWRVRGRLLPGGLPIALGSTQQTTDPGGGLVRCRSGVVGGVEAERAGHALQLDRPDFGERHRPSVRCVGDLLADQHLAGSGVLGDPRRQVDFFFLNDTATTEIYTLSLHDALPISSRIPSSVNSRIWNSSISGWLRTIAST